MAIFLFTIIGLMLAASAVNTERVRNFRMCPHSDCRVYDLFIEPCPEARYNRACGWPRNTTTTVSFIYNPEFDAILPKVQMYAETSLMDWPILNTRDTNACVYTTCPVAADTEQYWNIDLFVNNYYVRTFYTVKFVLWDMSDYQKCCFTFDINIV